MLVLNSPDAQEGNADMDLLKKQQSRLPQSQSKRFVKYAVPMVPYAAKLRDYK